MTLSRRSLLGFIAAAPFIVKAMSLMPVKALASAIDLSPGAVNYVPDTYTIRTSIPMGAWRRVIWHDQSGAIAPYVLPPNLPEEVF